MFTHGRSKSVHVLDGSGFSSRGSQGQISYLGSFSDPIKAAMRYDREAAKLQGAAAVLNFPPGTMLTPILTVVQTQPPVLPDGIACGQKGAATDGSPPAGNTSYNLEAAPGIPRTKKSGHRVRPAFRWWGVRHDWDGACARLCFQVATIFVCPDHKLSKHFHW
jgi:hypothetical protein